MQCALCFIHTKNLTAFSATLNTRLVVCVKRKLMNIVYLQCSAAPVSQGFVCWDGVSFKFIVWRVCVSQNKVFCCFMLLLLLKMHLHVILVHSLWCFDSREDCYHLVLCLKEGPKITTDAVMSNTLRFWIISTKCGFHLKRGCGCSDQRAELYL